MTAEILLDWLYFLIAIVSTIAAIVQSLRVSDLQTDLRYARRAVDSLDETRNHLRDQLAEMDKRYGVLRSRMRSVVDDIEE